MARKSIVTEAAKKPVRRIGWRHILLYLILLAVLLGYIWWNRVSEELYTVPAPAAIPAPPKQTTTFRVAPPAPAKPASDSTTEKNQPQGSDTTTPIAE